MENENYITKKGLQKLKKKYQQLKKKLRGKSQSEEPYLRQEAAKLRKILRHPRLIRKHKKNDHKIEMGCKVKVEHKGKEQEFEIVDSIEADPTEGKISHESKVGEALIGHKKGDEVTVENSHSEAKYKILAVS